MNFESELIFVNGLPMERTLTDDDIRQMEDRLDNLAQEPQSDPSEPSSHTIYEPKSDECRTITKGWKKSAATLEYRRNAVYYWKTGFKRRLSLSTVQKKYRLVKSERQLYDLARQINPETRCEKLRLIFDKTRAAYLTAEENLAIIHDSDLSAMAQQAAREVKLENFLVSPSWIFKFKSLNGIVSRKITKYVASNHREEELDRFISAAFFVHDVKSIIEERGADCVFNSDQSGFQYEFHSGRTLRTKGTTEVIATAQSRDKMTYSYTIMPIVDANGRFVGPLFILLQETTGVDFGPLVQRDLYKAPNIYVCSSRSGKMQREHFEKWLQDVYFLNVTKNSVLVIDSWSTYKNRELLASVTSTGYQFEIMTIPPKTTQFCQPLDVYFFRQYKRFVRIIWDRVGAQNFDTILHVRNNVLKLQSLAYNQICSQSYTDLWSVGWRYPGYRGEYEFIDMKTPVEFCFRSDAAKRNDPCAFAQCTETHFITCSWCRSSLCFSHFFVEAHLCNYVA